MIHDSGSQSSYISERIKEQLNLEIKDEMNFSFLEFVSEKPEKKPYGPLEIHLHTNERKKHNISTQLNDFQISCKENYEHPLNLNLAESGEGESNANVLMGSVTTTGCLQQKNH